MNKIISKEHFSEKVFKLVIEAPLIARSRKAGHFVIVRVGEKGERMPPQEQCPRLPITSSLSYPLFFLTLQMSLQVKSDGRFCNGIFLSEPSLP